MGVRTCVECGRAATGRRESCEVCGGFVDPPPGTGHDDPLGGETVALAPELLGPRAQDALGGPRDAGEPVPADLLEISFEEGGYRIRLRRGEMTVLGRDAAVSPHAGFLRDFANVSRRHVTLRLDDRGRAFVRDEFSTNWTVRNGSRLTPGAEWRLRDGDRVRLGTEVSGAVTLVASAPVLHTGQRSASPRRSGGPGSG